MRPPDRNQTVLTSLESYLREINTTPLLSAEEERELAHAIEAGDVTARDHMVRANLRLVVKIARGYTNKGLDLQDVTAEGNLGLLHAVERFDPSMNIRFSTYASCWIKASIKRALVNTAKAIRIPEYMVQLLADWRRATAKLLQEKLGRTPTPEEVAGDLGIPKKKLAIIQKAIRIRNAMPHSEQSESGWSINDLVVDKRTRAAEKAMLEGDEFKQVLNLIDQLDTRSATVIRLRFGLGGAEPQTLLEIGDHLGLSRERVRQIERDALKQLSDKLTEPTAANQEQLAPPPWRVHVHGNPLHGPEFA